MNVFSMWNNCLYLGAACAQANDSMRLYVRIFTCSYGLDFARPYVSDADIEPSTGEPQFSHSKLTFTSPHGSIATATHVDNVELAGGDSQI